MPEIEREAVSKGTPASRAALERLKNAGLSGATSGAPIDLRPRVRGRVTRVIDGYGFIQSDETDTNPFFHHSSVGDDGFDHLQPGTRVSYVEHQTDRGLNAICIRILEDEE